MMDLIANFAWGAAVLVIIAVGVFGAIVFRRVVEPNETHIVQGRKKTTIYGQSKDGNLETEGADLWIAKNAYWAWPSWVPVIGVQIIKMPLSIFAIKEKEYDAYDVGKVPFVVDITAFFRINKPAIAAKRIANLVEVEEQLHEILRGAARKVLAFHDIEEIMLERSKFGQMFTEETDSQLEAWGVTNVKNIELMDIRDPRDESSQTINDIMARKKAFINKESRVEVAAHQRDAGIAEIDAQRDVELQGQDAKQKVGERTATQVRQVGIADEHAQQEIKTEQRETAERDMAVLQVNTVREAEINRDAEVVQAEEVKLTNIIKAEGIKQQTILVAEGDLKNQTLNAEGLLAEGTAKAEANRLSEMSVVTPQIALAEEIGENEGYQKYLVDIRNVEKEEIVGVEKAKAFQNADIKIISNAGDAGTGLNKVMDVFSSNGGTSLAAMVEAFKQTPAGQKVFEKLVS